MEYIEPDDGLLMEYIEPDDGLLMDEFTRTHFYQWWKVNCQDGYHDDTVEQFLWWYDRLEADDANRSWPTLWNQFVLEEGVEEYYTH